MFRSRRPKGTGLLSTEYRCIEPKYGEDRRTETVRRELEEDDALGRVRADCIGRGRAAPVRVGSGRKAEHVYPAAKRQRQRIATIPRWDGVDPDSPPRRRYDRNSPRPTVLPWAWSRLNCQNR